MMQAFLPPSPFLGVAPPRRRTRSSATVKASASPDVVVIGAGIAGLSTAYELAQKGVSVQILTSPSCKSAAMASAGMLAPKAENVSGNMRKLFFASRELYPDYVRRLQRLVDVDVKYVSRNDYLIPSKTPLSGPDVLTGEALRRVEPALGPKVKAARRSLGDANVDSRRLMSALYEACISLGVKIEEEEVRSVIVSPDGQSVQAVETKLNLIVAGHYLIASGAWTSKLMPEIPMRPVKGQILSLAAPEDGPFRLNHVLYGHEVYIVPKNDGREFYVGATIEEAGFDTKTTASGISFLLNNAIELVPNLAQCEIRETWSGLRPATPDLQPVLGHSNYRNLTISSGYYRNGILMAPAASSIATAVILGEEDLLPRNLRDLADKFSYQRLHLTNDEKRDTTYSVPSRQTTEERSASNEVKSDEGPLRSSGKKDIVQLWKVNKDGSTEPVTPSQRFLQRQEVKASNSSDRGPENYSTSSVDDSPVSPSYQTKLTNVETYQGGEGFQQDPKFSENVSAENDAYDDVLHKRANADEVMSRAMAANRAFGREKSSLETDGSPQLSLSEHEVVAFDAALKEGVEEMARFEKHFDPNDPSVLATRAEQERWDLEEDAGSPINGAVVPSLAESGNGSFGNDSANGYY